MRGVVCVDPSQLKHDDFYMFRQGLPMIRIDPHLLWALQGSRSLGMLSINMFTPDKTRFITLRGGSGANNFAVCMDPKSIPYTFTQPPTMQNFSVAMVATSDQLFAVGGGSARELTVYRWADLGVETVVVTGLGAVVDLRFSPDGAKLLVAHSIAPFLRIYNCADWSYIDAPTVATGAVSGGAEFTADSQFVVSRYGTGRYLRVHNVVNLAVVNSLSAPVGLSRGNLSGPACRSIVRHPTKPGKMLLLGRSGTASAHAAPIGYEYDVATNTLTPFQTAIHSGNSDVRSHYFNPLDNSITMIHDEYINPTKGALVCTRVEVDTYTEVDSGDIRDISAWHSKVMYFSDVIEFDCGQISGTVRDVNNLPAQRVVRAYRRSDGLLCAQTLSDPVTGDYVLQLPDQELYDVQFLTEDGELLNDLFYSKSIPAEV